MSTLNKSWEIWNFLINKAGLDVKTYDAHLVEALCVNLNIPLPCKDVKRELQKRNISTELFIEAFFKAIQPYAQMLSDLCVFFYLHGVKRTNKEMKIFFDFGKGIEDLKFDLNHFKEVLWKYKKATQSVTIFAWNANNLWALSSIFNEDSSATPQDQHARDWLLKYEEYGRFSFPFPNLPSTGIDEINQILQRVWQVWTTIILECRKYGSTRDDLKHYFETQRDKQDLPEEILEESYESLGRYQEIPDVKGWDVRTLRTLDSDGWLGALFRRIWGFIERLQKHPEKSRMDIARPIIQEINDLLSSLPRSSEEREVLIQELFDLLNLPIWNKRHELYQTWILTLIDKTLEKYQRTIYHDDGTLILRFSGTHIGTIETVDGRIHLWSELRSPFDHPIGKGRKKSIQPDYSLTFEPVSNPSKTIVSIECKQYQRAKPQNFVNALIDYARGRPNARIILTNYGNIPEKMMDQIMDDSLKLRTSAIGNLMPGEIDKIENFKQRLLECMPSPAREVKIEDESSRELFNLIAVDISGSMNSILNEEEVQQMLRMIVESSPSASLLAVDDFMRNEWKNAKKGMPELLKMPRTCGTDLSNILSAYDLDKAVILTDNDGYRQLRDMTQPPKLVIEIADDKKDMVFHYS